MTMRTCLMVLLACAGLGAAVGVVQSQDSPSVCPAPSNSASGGSGLIWAFN
jgi:hypothetical protein